MVVSTLLWRRAKLIWVSFMFSLRELLTVIDSNRGRECILDVASGKSYTYGDFFNAANTLGFYFLERGLKRGDRIAINLPNSFEFILCYWAAFLKGITVVPIGQDVSQRYCSYILDVAKPKLVVDVKSDLNKIIANPVDSLDNLILAYDEDMLAIFFTSGTTGKPKGVCHSIKNMLSNAKEFNNLVGFNKNLRMLHVLPMGYMAGFLNTVLCPMLVGGTVVIAPQFNSINALQLWDSAVAGNVNALWLTPTMVSFLIRLHRDEKIADWTEKNLKHVFVGTAPLPLATKEGFEKTFKVRCLESYGMSEIMLVSANASHFIHKNNSVGKLLNGFEVKLEKISEQKNELYIFSPYPLLGYLDEKGNIMSPLQSDWMPTGDEGYIDNEGYLFITDRIKDLIIRGGKNISPRAIEEIILDEPSIKDVAIVGIPHPFWGEEIVAFLTVNGNCEFDRAKIVTHCKNYLVADEMPTQWKVLKDMPRSSTGKIKKDKLKELL